MKTKNRIHLFTGTHVLGEMYGVLSEDLDSIDKLVEILNEGIEQSHATCEGTLVKRFYPHGVSIVILLSESHVSIHTYPEINALFVDAFTCGLNCNPEAIIDNLIVNLNPSETNINVITRGKETLQFEKV